MLEVRWQVEFLSILLILLLALIDVGANLFDHRFRIGAETAQHIYKQTVVLRKHIKNVGRFDCLASTGAGTFQRALKKIGRVRSNADAFAEVLPRGTQPVPD